MFAALKNLFVSRDADDLIATAERSTPLVSQGVLAARHADLLARGQKVRMDPATLIILIQLFGPLIVKLIERAIARRERAQAEERQ